MKAIYILNFESWDYKTYCNMTFSRIGKLPIVKVERLHGDLPFIEYFKMAILGEIGRELVRQSDAVSYNIRVLSGFEKGIVYCLRSDGMYQPYDKIAGIELPELARPTKPQKRKSVK